MMEELKLPDLSVVIAGVRLKNPVMTASGTFGSGREFAEFMDLNRLGGITVKGVSAVPWKGNPAPRIAETYGGMLNSVGLQNPGAAAFIQEDLPFLKQFDTCVMVNLCGHTLEEYVAVAAMFQGVSVDLLELNISCPNLEPGAGGLAFGTSPAMVEKVVSTVKKVCEQPLIVKLSPNVTDIRETAKAAESGGADGLSLINTLLGMKIDVARQKPVLARKIGGLSGPAIRPVALRMVYEAVQCVKIPVIGMGGIMTGEDALEFIMAGASAVAVGTASFHNPCAAVEVLEGIQAYMQDQHIDSLDQIRGVV